jgi:DNA processing protein
MLEALRPPAVAIVGSRAASQYALDVSARLGSDLARHGVVVVSGLARGVDSAAHRGALDAGGLTIAVLGCGIDVTYPREHAQLSAAIRRQGLLVSEFPPGTPPLRGHFPQRNRVISGLSRAVVVVEAAEKSGSLITAAFALDQGRDVLAVPGNVLGGRNRGAHALLRDGAKIVESADDILEEIGLPAAGHRDSGIGTDEPQQPDPSSEDPILMHMIAGDSYDLDELARRTRIEPSGLLRRLLELELSGAVQRVDGARFVRCRRNVLR